MISVSSSYKKTGLCVKDEGMLLISDIEQWLTRPDINDAKSIYIELTEGITEVERGLFALIPSRT